ncbi:Membrane protease YdiL, CAAX protease family [Catalinimonas alkaloidigena]|uniref:Membrane protease YdiL, CAAX protease family n=1 Tax=Catalinimonas alkaloidigena TaxID=1075417 RepID=A0A1G9G9V5_9BACT|nr:CPBP family intramembrane glutamic endopeptidase [Catalinimonas alkaloidigena]SDK97504.1 Membrane protease YdiL, CAAX protease family [Catalinimonas alkaloidigena]
MKLDELKQAWQQTPEPAALSADALHDLLHTRRTQLQSRNRRLRWIIGGGSLAALVLFLLVSNFLHDPGSGRGFLKMLGVLLLIWVGFFALHYDFRTTRYGEALPQRLRLLIRRVKWYRSLELLLLLGVVPALLMLGIRYDPDNLPLLLVGVGLSVLQALVIRRRYQPYLNEWTGYLRQYEPTVEPSRAATGFIRYSGRDTALILLVFVGIYGLVNVLAMGYVKYTIGFEKFFEGRTSMPLAVHLVNHFGKALGLTAGVLGIKVLWQKHRWAAVGFRKTTTRWLLIGGGVGLSLTWVMLPLAKGIGAWLPAWRQTAQGVFLHNGYPGWENGILLFLIVGLVPLSEELFFRGFLYARFRTKFPVWGAILLSSGIFALTHLQPLQASNAALGGAVFALLYERSRSLWPSILAHTLHNGMGALLALGVDAWGWTF